MRLSVLIPAALLAPFTLAAPSLEDRAVNKYKAVVKDVASISSKITTLNNTLNGFKPDSALGLFTALQIQQQTNALGDALTTATKDASSSSKWNDDQSLQVAEAVLNLTPNIFSLLDNIVAHKPAFATAVLFVGDLSKTVHDSLVKQKAQSAQFGAAVTKKLSPTYAQFAPGINQSIQQAFAKAIKKYNTCSGVLCLPAIPGKA